MKLWLAVLWLDNFFSLLRWDVVHLHWQSEDEVSRSAHPVKSAHPVAHVERVRPQRSNVKGRCSFIISDLLWPQGLWVIMASVLYFLGQSLSLHVLGCGVGVRMNVHVWCGMCFGIVEGCGVSMLRSRETVSSSNQKPEQQQLEDDHGHDRRSQTWCPATFLSVLLLSCRQEKANKSGRELMGWLCGNYRNDEK